MPVHHVHDHERETLSLDHDRHKLTWNASVRASSPPSMHLTFVSRQVIVIQFVLGGQLAKVSGAYRRHYTRARAAAAAPTPAG